MTTLSAALKEGRITGEVAFHIAIPADMRPQLRHDFELPDALKSVICRDDTLPIDGATLFVAGNRRRDYMFMGWRPEEVHRRIVERHRTFVAGTAYVVAGCRIFTFEEAQAHWYHSTNEGHVESRDLVARIEEWVKLSTIKREPRIEHSSGMSWIAKVVDLPPSIKFLDSDLTYRRGDVEEFLGSGLHGMFKNWLLYQRGRKV